MSGEEDNKGKKSLFARATAAVGGAASAVKKLVFGGGNEAAEAKRQAQMLAISEDAINFVESENSKLNDAVRGGAFNSKSLQRAGNAPSGTSRDTNVTSADDGRGVGVGASRD